MKTSKKEYRPVLSATIPSVDTTYKELFPQIPVMVERMQNITTTIQAALLDRFLDGIAIQACMNARWAEDLLNDLRVNTADFAMCPFILPVCCLMESYLDDDLSDDQRSILETLTTLTRDESLNTLMANLRKSMNSVYEDDPFFGQEELIMKGPKVNTIVQTYMGSCMQPQSYPLDELSCSLSVDFYELANETSEEFTYQISRLAMYQFGAFANSLRLDIDLIYQIQNAYNL